MDYQNTLKYLYESVPMFQQVGKEAYKPGLDTTHRLDEYFGHPHRLFKTIHIAGTNGKGSCSHTIAAVLQSAGYRVGLFTSPHLVDFRERIRVNGETMPESYVVDFVEKHRSFFEPLHPSFFELTTAMAFRYFADSKVDVAVVEVGMGGRLDCTNIIRPDLCVITNIGLDHIQYLGDTLEKIAAEKAGIIKEGVPVVIGRAEGKVKEVFDAKAKEMNTPIAYARQTAEHSDAVLWGDTELEKEKQRLGAKEETGKETVGNRQEGIQQDDYRQDDYRPEKIQQEGMRQDDYRQDDYRPESEPEDCFLCDERYAIDRILKKRKEAIRFSNEKFADGLYLELTGLYQVENGFTIITALDELAKRGYHIAPKHYLEGFSDVCRLTGLRGRWQKVHQCPDIVCDTGHNVDGLKYICKQLEAIREREGKKIHIVFGMVNDKDISGVLKLLPKDATYYFTQASVKRALPAAELRQMALKAGLEGDAYATVAEAVQAAKKNCLPKDFIFVGGSSFIVADLLANRDTLDLY